MLGKTSRSFPIIGKIVFALLLAVSVCRSALAAPPLLDTNTQARLVDALACMNMTERDLAFEKDVVKPGLYLERSHRLLLDPLELPVLADEVYGVCERGDSAKTWALFADLLECEDPLLMRRPNDAPEFSIPDGLSPAFRDALTTFLKAAGQAAQVTEMVFGGISVEKRRKLAAGSLAGLFNAEDDEVARAAIVAAGPSLEDVEQAIADSLAIDPEPTATNEIAWVQRIDRGTLLRAGQLLQSAAEELAEAAVGITNGWPEQPVQIESALGPIVIGTRGADRYESAALLILDPAGDDVYTGAAGSANGLLDASLAVVVDLSGDDRYVGAGVVGPGMALFGVCVLEDLAGNDSYIADYAGQGCGLYGAAWLEDRAGDDVYRARGLAQGAGVVGVGYLRDADGDDLFDVGLCGQGYAGVLGVGLLVDAAGDDRYTAGGREHDYERNDDRFVSLSQGFAIGMRPYAGGGVAALIDLSGNDSYTADVFGQGVSYWYSVGLLMDGAGEDTYTLYQYGQGSGVHLSSGLLADFGGRDFYTGYILAQGNAHDYAVGMLFDKGNSDDTYTADHHSQGRAINNALGILVDSGGNDAYFARQNNRCQGIGNEGGRREYGSLAVLMDLQGVDSYSCGATNGARLLRPNFGIVYDVEDEP